MKIATWNVNSIRARVPVVTAWLERAQPDVLLLQETKCLPEKFPREHFEHLPYNIELVGEPSLNGVAILAKSPIEDVLTTLPGDPGDEEARYIEATVNGVRVASVYVPNGTALDSPRFP
ncbi:MAG: exodeoxyribonuclease III, partial [Pseudomonadota bacterium]